MLNKVSGAHYVNFELPLIILHRYCIDRVYQASRSGHPMELTEAVFDIICPWDQSSEVLAHIDCLSLTLKLITDFHIYCKYKYRIVYGDLRISAAILDLCGIALPADREVVLELLSNPRSQCDLSTLKLNEVGFHYFSRVSV